MAEGGCLRETLIFVAEHEKGFRPVELCGKVARLELEGPVERFKGMERIVELKMKRSKGL